MADEATLNVEIRTSFGKGAARKIRAANNIPAVLYGHGSEPVHLTLPGHQTMLLTRKANAVLDLQIEGKSQLALVKDVQKDPVRQIIEHIDLVIVKKGEKVTVDVPVHVEGESAPTLEELQAFLEAEGVAKYTWPETVEPFNAFPRTPSLKVVKREVVEQILERRAVPA